MKKGIISNVEKLQIIDFVKENRPVIEIAVELDRSVESVEKYIDEIKSIFKEKVEPIIPGVDDKVIDQVKGQLSQLGLTEISINNKLNKIIKELSESELRDITTETLYAYCIRLINVGDVMISKTDGGQKGVAVMTEAAAQKSDHKPTPKKINHEHIYKIY